MQNSTIEWTDHTFSPWHGCVKVSPGCQNCYALALDRRFGRAVWGPAKTTPRMGMSEQYWKQPLKWNRDALRGGVRRRVFCASMADVFEDHPGVVEWRQRLFDLIGQTSMLDWQLLTKRPENINRMIPLDWRAFPPKNVWYGTSVEDQARADERIPELLKVNAWLRFLSCEPLIALVKLPTLAQPWKDWRRCGGPGIHWVIGGGESGQAARPCWPEWAYSLRDQCQDMGMAFFWKQWGQYEPYEEHAQEPYWQDQRGNLHDAHWLGVLNPETGEINPGWHEDSIMSPYLFRRVGKHAAGNLLDGRQWLEMPS